MRRARAFFYVCAGVFLLALSYHLGATSARAQASRRKGDDPQTVYAEKFVLRDRNGAIRGMWTATGDTALLFICDDRNKGTVALAMRGGASNLLINDSEGRARAALGVASDGDPNLDLKDREGRSRAGLGFLGGIAGLTVSGTHKNIGAMMAVRENDEPFLMLRDWAGRQSHWGAESRALRQNE